MSDTFDTTGGRRGKTGGADSPVRRDGPPECGNAQLVMHLYGETSGTERDRIEGHLASCASCRAELASLRGALDVVDRARLTEMATFDAPGDWGTIDSLLSADAARRAGRVSMPAMMARAAGILLIAATAFVAGRVWDGITSPEPDMPAEGGSPTSPEAFITDPSDRLRVFAERTNGYLHRTRLVLLEFANGDAASDSPALIAASRTLLRENRDARRIAGLIRDQRLDEILLELEAILGDISRSSGSDGAELLEQVRTQVDGLLDRIELLSAPPARMAEDRSRT